MRFPSHLAKGPAVTRKAKFGGARWLFAGQGIAIEPAATCGRLPAEYHSQHVAADLEAIRHQTAHLNPDGVTTVEMVKVTQRMLAVSIPEVASLDAVRTFTNEFLQP